VVDFDEKYIVSASGDRTIKVWNTNSCEFVRTLNGHKRGIACLQYHNDLVVSGSSDNTIRLWDIESGSCLRVLEGHEELVRCIRFDSKRIVSGAYDGKIKVWDLNAAKDPRAPAGTLCIRTLVEHSGRVFRLQFDEFQIVSSSHDDTILIWDFLNFSQPDKSSPMRTYTYVSNFWTDKNFKFILSTLYFLRQFFVQLLYFKTWVNWIIYLVVSKHYIWTVLSYCIGTWHHAYFCLGIFF